MRTGGWVYRMCVGAAGIRASAANHPESARGLDGFAHVGVANCGTPVDQQTLPRLFERFFRAQAARSHSGKHHGLGLAIVKAVAAVHRGDVFACSADGVNIFGFTMAVLPTATTIAHDAHNNIKERLPARLQT